MKNVSIKLKFRRSVNPEKEGSLIYQLIYERKVCRITSKYKIFNHEWDEATGQILFSSLDSSRDSQLGMIRFNVDWELHQLCKIVDTLALSGQEWTFSDLTSHFNSFIDKDSSVFHFIQMQIQRKKQWRPAGAASTFYFIQMQIQRKKQLGKVRSSETYQATLNSFMSFRCGVDLTFDMIDSELMELYEAELQNRGLTRNTSSFYLRILRTNYKLAVEKGLTQDCHPFKRVYCGIDKTVKRSLSFAKIKQIKELDLSLTPSLDFARDMFLFSFCTRGMSFVDMAYLKKKDLKNGYLTYRRKKTGQLLTVEWTRQMQDIIDKYPINPTQYLLPLILREDGSERRQYQNQMMKINRRLKRIACLVKLPVALSLYYSRHSWATIARGKDIPLSVISEALGHDSEITTQIYLDSIKSVEVDKANRKILKDL